MAEHVKIGDVSPRIHYTADGAQTQFTYPFPVFEDADLKVHVDADQKALNADYAVTGAGSSVGGAVVFAAPPPPGAAVTLRRALAVRRLSDFQESGEFRAKVINDELDAVVAYCQELRDGLGRALRLSGADTDAALTLPAGARRAGKVLGFDAAGGAAVSEVTMGGLDGLARGAEAAVKSAAAASASETAALRAAEAAQASAQASAASAASNLFARVRRTGAAGSPYQVARVRDDGALFTAADDGDVTFLLPAAAPEGGRYGFLREGASHTVKIAPAAGGAVNGRAAGFTVSRTAGEMLIVIADEETPGAWTAVPWTQAAAGAGLMKAGAVMALDPASANVWSAPQRTPPVRADSGAFDMDAGQDFVCAPAADAVISFSNIAPGQRGMIRLVNPRARAVAFAPGVRADAYAAKTLSKAGTYNLGYWAHDAAQVDVTYSGGLI